MAVAPLTNKPNLPNSVTGIAVFGSYGRGDFDVRSDLDLLVVVRDGSGTTPERQITQALEPLLPRKPSISFYGEGKLRALYEEGNLFAWHLFHESREIEGFPCPSELFRKPRPYETCAEDLEGLRNILDDVPSQITRNPWNAIFELGILYVCARNIAMSASWHLKTRPDFGRYSPFGLSQKCRFPLSKEQYELTMMCRMASTRGEVPPNVAPHIVAELSMSLQTWAGKIADQVRILG